MVHMWRSEDNFVKSVLSFHQGVLRTELGSSGLAASIFICRATSQAQEHHGTSEQSWKVLPPSVCWLKAVYGEERKGELSAGWLGTGGKENSVKTRQWV